MPKCHFPNQLLLDVVSPELMTVLLSTCYLIFIPLPLHIIYLIKSIKTESAAHIDHLLHHVEQPPLPPQSPIWLLVLVVGGIHMCNAEAAGRVVFSSSRAHTKKDLGKHSKM